MRRLILMALAFAASAPAPVVPAIPGKLPITGDGYSVTLQSLTKHTSPGARDIFEYKYNYDFKDRDNIYIPSLGSVPPKGSFTYHSYEPQILFMDRAAGNHLLELVPQYPGIGGGGGSTPSTPSVTDFPKEIRTGKWTPLREFPAVAQDVIQKHFSDGFITDEVAKTNYYITGYIALAQPDTQLKSEISIMVSQPFNVQGDELEYHLQFLARDKPKLSSVMRYGYDSSQSTRTAAASFVNQFISELNNQAKASRSNSK